MAVAAQPAKPERIGVIHLGEVFATLVDGLRAGLKELGLQDGKQFVLEVHDLKGDLKSAPRVAETLEREKVKLIFTNTTSITGDAFKATKSIPIVFAVGSDPVASRFRQILRPTGGTAHRHSIYGARSHRQTFGDSQRVSAQAAPGRGLLRSRQHDRRRRVQVGARGSAAYEHQAGRTPGEIDRRTQRRRSTRSRPASSTPTCTCPMPWW